MLADFYTRQKTQDAHVDNGRWTGSVGLQAAASGQGMQDCRQWQVDREGRIAACEAAHVT